MDGVLFRTLKLDHELATRRLIAHLEAVERAGGLAVLLWHPNVADARRYPGWYDTWRDALDHLATRPAWVAPAGEIAHWWRERRAKARDLDGCSLRGATGAWTGAERPAEPDRRGAHAFDPFGAPRYPRRPLLLRGGV